MHATEFVESYIDAWNHCDAQGVADHLTDDGIYRDIPQNEQRSHDELVAYLTGFFAHYQLRYELIGEILKSENAIAFQYRASPPEDVAAGKFRNQYGGAEFVTLYGDAAMTITDYYDIPGMNRPSNIARLSSGKTRIHKYAKSGLNSGQLLEYKHRLEHIMQSQQAFLRSDLTLPKLAQAVDCSINHLSQVINSGFGLSFFDYLNQYRIDHARALLSEIDGRGNAILNIAFTVGFNSNSAFYAAFKKRVGQTPAQYRQKHLRNPC